MPWYVIVIIDIAIIYFFFGHSIRRRLMNSAARVRDDLRGIEKGIALQLERNRDILPLARAEAMAEAVSEIHSARSGDIEEARRCLAKYSRESTLAKISVPGMDRWAVGGILDLLIVAIGIAFSVRSIFIQPFQIPTGSMQPTLYGNHFVSCAEPPKTNILSRFLSYMNYGRRVVDVVVEADGALDLNSVREVGRIPFFHSCQFTVGNQIYTIPGTLRDGMMMLNDQLTKRVWDGPLSFKANDLIIAYKDYDGVPRAVRAKQDGVLDWSTMNVSRDSLNRVITTCRIGEDEYRFELPPEDVKHGCANVYNSSKKPGCMFRKGDVLLRGYLEDGDHLFVNRLSLAFSEPKRGDVMVFMTTGLTSPDGRPFGGSYYVKRLVGLPGDTLKIVDRKLYVKEKGAADFRVIDGTDNVGFERMYSFKGGYHGYAHMNTKERLGYVGGGSTYLKSNRDTFEVPEGHYFMMGDNSENSWDSRWFGPVPRANLVGSPFIVWWPFSRRLGRVDIVEPDPALGDTPPTEPVYE